MPAFASRPSAQPLGETSSYLSERQRRSTNTLSIQRPRPSIETRKAGLDQRAGEGRAGELAALVGVEDLRPSLSKPCRIGPARPRAPRDGETRRSCSTAAGKEPPGSPNR